MHKYYHHVMLLSWLSATGLLRVMDILAQSPSRCVYIAPKTVEEISALAVPASSSSFTTAKSTYLRLDSLIIFIFPPPIP
jgi:hypothetical protein